MIHSKNRQWLSSCQNNLFTNKKCNSRLLPCKRPSAVFYWQINGRMKEMSVVFLASFNYIYKDCTSRSWEKKRKKQSMVFCTSLFQQWLWYKHIMDLKKKVPNCLDFLCHFLGLKRRHDTSQRLLTGFWCVASYQIKTLNEK